MCNRFRLAIVIGDNDTDDAQELIDSSDLLLIIFNQDMYVGEVERRLSLPVTRRWKFCRPSRKYF